MVLISEGKSSSAALTAGLRRLMVPLQSLFSQYFKKESRSVIFAPNPGVSFWSRIVNLFVLSSEVFVPNMRVILS